jgi:hypothetical protein
MYLQHDSLYQEDVKEYGERHQVAHLSSLIIGTSAPQATLWLRIMVLPICQCGAEYKVFRSICDRWNGR